MTKKTSNQMWGGRFAAGPDAIMEAINASIGFDNGYQLSLMSEFVLSEQIHSEQPAMHQRFYRKPSLP